MIRRTLTLLALTIFGMPLLAGCGLIVPLAIIAVETAVETATPAIVNQVAAPKPARREDEPLVEPETAKP